MPSGVRNTFISNIFGFWYGKKDSLSAHQDKVIIPSGRQKSIEREVTNKIQQEICALASGRVAVSIESVSLLDYTYARTWYLRAGNYDKYLASRFSNPSCVEHQPRDAKKLFLPSAVSMRRHTADVKPGNRIAGELATNKPPGQVPLARDTATRPPVLL